MRVIVKQFVIFKTDVLRLTMVWPVYISMKFSVKTLVLLIYEMSIYFFYRVKMKPYVCL